MTACGRQSRKPRLLVTLDFSNLVLIGKNIRSGPNGDGGYLSLSESQISVFYRTSIGL